ncbi:hypothetical protein [Algimonas arctica]|nr:hypothetical protein [Algimonas arctica]
MSIITDMSEPERQSWITLLADGFVFVWFWKAIAPGWSLNPSNLSPGETGELFLKLVIITIFYHAVIGIIFSVRRRQGEVDRDERDVAIQSFGSRVGYIALHAGVGLTTVGILMSYIIADEYTGSIAFETPVEILFSLVFVSYVADLMRHGAVVLRYRAT